MSGTTYFVQECPTCGRRVQVRVDYLGRGMICQHCSGEFIARDPDNFDYKLDDSDVLLKRADELIRLADRQQPLPR